ncbi:MAG: metal-dependent hydrolase [Pseudomonadota bacterium]
MSPHRARQETEHIDSVTQIVFGASVAAACAPAGHRRRALAVGAALGTLPDLDVLIDYGDAVSNFTYHRGFSHSLFVLTPFAIGLWAVLRRFWEPVRAAPKAWFFAILLALVTHPLLDAHTAYGTQIWWPLNVAPTSWSTLFIIDPAYTLPLLLAVIVAAFAGARPLAGQAIVTGLSLCLLYLAWTWVAKLSFEQTMRTQLAQDGVAYRSIFSTPSPFNTLMWRGIVLTDSGYLEGRYSLLADERVHFIDAPFNRDLLAEAANLDAVQRLDWFARGFVRADVTGNELILTDLRMGQHPTFVFQHAVATMSDEGWSVTSPRRIPVDFDARQLDTVWDALLNGNAP